MAVKLIFNIFGNATHAMLIIFRFRNGMIFIKVSQLYKDLHTDSLCTVHPLDILLIDAFNSLLLRDINQGMGF